MWQCLDDQAESLVWMEKAEARYDGSPLQAVFPFHLVLASFGERRTTVLEDNDARHWSPRPGKCVGKLIGVGYGIVGSWEEAGRRVGTDIVMGRQESDHSMSVQFGKRSLQILATVEGVLELEVHYIELMSPFLGFGHMHKGLHLDRRVKGINQILCVR